MMHESKHIPSLVGNSLRRGHEQGHKDPGILLNPFTPGILEQKGWLLRLVHLPAFLYLCFPF